MEEFDHLVLGSCSFTAEGWEKTFYPQGLKKTDYLGYYAEQFRSVEVDATFYRIPSERTVRNWYAQTPDDFTFACKVPQSITHERCLEDSDGELSAFVSVMSVLQHKLGPMLLQFPYFNRKTFPSRRNSSSGCRGSWQSCPRDFHLRWRFATRRGWVPSFWICCASTKWHLH